MWCWFFTLAMTPQSAAGSCANSATPGPIPRDRWADVQRKNTLVFGVNPQNARSHAKFIDKCRLPFRLLVDRGQRMGALYKTKGLMVKRTVYLIGPDGIVRFAERGTPDPGYVLSQAT